MTRKKYMALINKEIDGIITQKEKDKLHSYLTINLEAKTFYNQLLHTCNLLNKVVKVEPSPNMKKTIMNSIDVNRYPIQKRKATFKASSSKLFSKINPRVAYAFVSGIIIGILMSTLFLSDLTQNDGINFDTLYGTIGLSEEAGFENLETITIELPDIQGALILKRSRNIIGLDINLNTIMYEWDIILTFNTTHMSFNGFKPSNYSKIMLENGESYVKATTAGTSRYFLLFNKKSSGTTSMNLRLLQSGNERYSHTISLRPDRDNGDESDQNN